MQIAYLTVTRSDCFLNGNSRVDKAKRVLGMELENHKFEYVPKWNKFGRVKPFYPRIPFKLPGPFPDYRPINACIRSHEEKLGAISTRLRKIDERLKEPMEMADPILNPGHSREYSRDTCIYGALI